MSEKEKQKLAIRDILKGIRFNSMQEAKEAILHLLAIETMRFPSLNDLLEYIGREKISYGDDWGWAGLYYDFLSNKYGAAVRISSPRKATYFVLQLPPVHELIGCDEVNEKHS